MILIGVLGVRCRKLSDARNDIKWTTNVSRDAQIKQNGERKGEQGEEEGLERFFFINILKRVSL